MTLNDYIAYLTTLANTTGGDTEVYINREWERDYYMPAPVPELIINPEAKAPFVLITKNN